MTRLQTSANIAHDLQGWSDQALLDFLHDCSISAVGHGTIFLPSHASPVFVKLLPLTPLEMSGQHVSSTVNYFQLPPYYQYRLGSCGFGAWREVQVHQLANQWVASEQCVQHPLLHHWRVLPIAPIHHDDRINLQLWGNCEAIHRRVAAISTAHHSVVLFLEHYPLTLSQWFREQWLHSANPMAIVTTVESKLTAILAFINSQGLLHLDAHFDNILTDRQQLFLTDYGLALSSQFQLDVAEQQFFQQHQNFDICTALTSLAHAIVSRYDARPDWRAALQDLIDAEHKLAKAVPADVRTYLISRTPLVMKIGDFYRQLGQDLTTPYPAAELQEMLDDL